MVLPLKGLWVEVIRPSGARDDRKSYVRCQERYRRHGENQAHGWHRWHPMGSGFANPRDATRGLGVNSIGGASGDKWQGFGLPGYPGIAGVKDGQAERISFGNAGEFHADLAIGEDFQGGG